MRGTRRAGVFGRGRGGGGKGGGGGAVILILVAVAIFILARLLAIALRFALSRKREFLADAGAVELTKNADAMIGALRKIEGCSEIEAPSQVQEMFLDHPQAASLFATHPSIDDRVAALVRYAGGRDLPVQPRIPDRLPDKPAELPRSPPGGPWGGGPWGGGPWG
jgi:heat shock protein HtpX